MKTLKRATLASAHMTDMVENLQNPKSLLAELVESKRAEAKTLGRPIRRMNHPSLLVKPTAHAYMRDGELQFKDLRQPPRPLATDDLEPFMSFPEGSSEMKPSEIEYDVLLVPDTEVFHQLTALTSSMEEDELRLGRRLRVASSLPQSVRFPILTKRLAEGWWMPSDLDPDSLEEWAHAFGINAPSETLLLSALAEKGLSGNRVPMGFETKVRALAKTETWLMGTAQYGGMAADCSLYGSLEEVVSRHNEIRLFDSGLAEINTILGEHSELWIESVDEETFEARVSSPFKIKAGATVVIHDGINKISSTLERTWYENGSLYGEFVTPGLRSRGYRMFTEAARTGAKLYVAKAPFNGVPKRAEDNRWLSGDEKPQRITREVPLDVLLAGGPTA